jgi:hypothetical protein
MMLVLFEIILLADIEEEDVSLPAAREFVLVIYPKVHGCYASWGSEERDLAWKCD